MPTARELLEQADALMRRNRSAQIDDIPVLTDSVSPLSESRHGMRMPLTDAQPPVARGTQDAIPTLTERVAPDVAEETDSVAQEGEPSDWLDLDGGEPSITGDAPDSIAIVPPVAFEQTDDAALIQSAEHEEIELTTPVEEEFDEEIAALAAPLPEPEPPIPEFVPLVVEPVPPIVEPVLAAPEPVVIVETPAILEPEPAAPEPVVIVETPAILEPELAAPEPPAIVEPPMVITADTLATVLIPLAPPPTPAVPEPAPPPVAMVDDNARWDAVAEEIRMQVLQRIDLFTDTGLREQLGRRLQPIVDRASADLVATINLHVGELLRAYVAEAIEREIENWRKNN